MRKRTTHFALGPGHSWDTIAACGDKWPGVVTSLPQDVTCPACRETDAWRKAEREARGLPLLGVL